MIATLGALRDPRIWVVIAVGITMRIGFEYGFGRHVENTLVEREERLSSLSPEDRLDEEVRTWGAITNEVLGVDVSSDLERALDEQRAVDHELRRTLEAAGYQPLAADRFRPSGISPPLPGGPAPGGLVVGANGAVVKSALRVRPEDRRAPVPAWAVAGAAGLLIAGVGGVISLVLLRRAGDDEDEPATTDAQEPRSARA